MDIWNLVLLFVIGAIAGFINVMAGGGSALTLPALIFLGLEGSVANGTNRIAIGLQNIFAVASFKKEKFSEFSQSLRYAVFTLPGAVVGAIAAVKISNESFQRILAIVMVGIVISMFFSQSGISPKHKLPKWSVYLALFAIGFYGGFLQVGVGFVLMAALYHLENLSLIHVNMHKVFIILIYTIPALIIFALTHNVQWIFGLSLAAGNSFGAWWSAHFAIKGGEKIIRIVLAIAIVAMAIKLFKF